MDDKPASYKEWIDGIKSRDYESILDEAFDKFWPEYQFKERGVVATKDNVVYVEFK